MYSRRWSSLYCQNRRSRLRVWRVVNFVIMGIRNPFPFFPTPTKPEGSYWPDFITCICAMRNFRSVINSSRGGQNWISVILITARRRSPPTRLLLPPQSETRLAPSRLDSGKPTPLSPSPTNPQIIECSRVFLSSSRDVTMPRLCLLFDQ